MALFVLILVTGFFFAARQHFSSVDYGIRNSRLRKQLDDLETEKRRLLLAREVALSPVQIKIAAHRLGIGQAESATTELALVSTPTRSVTAPATASAKEGVKREAAYSVVAASFSANVSKLERSDRPKKEQSERARVIPTAAVAAR